ncbi:MAG: VWA domain-containing protein, partial [Emticicia sp.]|uniref:von Willebrand factor type A domain-containing protein n=1 Tax=Emticicia sp. TaxID=1930953 RepID=UPI003BA4F517
MKTKIWVLIALVFGIFAFTTQRTIKGKVLSASDGSALPGVMVAVKGTSIGTQTDANGDFQLTMPTGSEKLIFTYIGYKTKEVKVGKDSMITVKLEDDTHALEEVVVVGYSTQQRRETTGAVSILSKNKVIPPASPMLQGRVPGLQVQPSGTYRERKKRYSADKPKEDFNTEEYNSLVENIFQEAKSNPLTTFSIDVDRAGYSNVRRMLNAGTMPPKDAIRIEEMVNYFDYDYPQPVRNEPVTINTELSDSPWNKGLKLLQIGIQAQKISTENLPASNL